MRTRTTESVATYLHRGVAGATVESEQANQRMGNVPVKTRVRRVSNLIAPQTYCSFEHAAEMVYVESTEVVDRMTVLGKSQNEGVGEVDDG